MPAPPTPARDMGLVLSIIRAHPGQTIPELALSSGLWTSELTSLTRALRDMRLIETRGDGRLYPYVRKPKQEPSPPSPMSRLLAWFRRANA